LNGTKVPYLLYASTGDEAEPLKFHLIFASTGDEADTPLHFSIHFLEKYNYTPYYL
jgi:hypothetical protein